MSLINDALRRARQSEKEPLPAGKTSATPGVPLPLDPVEPPPLSPWPSFLGIAATALIVLALVGAGGWFIWKSWNDKHSKKSVTVAAHHPARPALNANASTTKTNASPGSASSTAAAPLAAPATSPTNVASATTGSNAATAAPPIAAVAPPVKWPIFKLQGIFYRPPRSSVMLNKQTVFVNDVIEGAKVVEIGSQSVTLVLSGQTNVLTLR